MKYQCQNCGNVSLKWEGKCSSCGEWGTLEEKEDVPSAGKKGGNSNVSAATIHSITPGKDQGGASKTPQKRIDSGVSEFDRVLGGGFVPGEVVLLTGEPGVGKSTLLLQMVSLLGNDKNVLYFSGEESVSQLQNRYKRIASEGGGMGDLSGETSKSASKTAKSGSIPEGYEDYSENFDISSDNNLERLITLLGEKEYDLVVVDSIQSLMSSTSESFPGSITQVRNCGYKLVDHAKRNGVVIVVVGQINKSGVVAGPKVLEHMVDAVMHMEGDKDDYYKILRAQKNRFGSTDEIGVFKMGSGGLMNVQNPSQIFLTEEEDVSGSVVGAIVEGSRVVFLEVQALVVDHGSSPGSLLRVANGIKRQRVEMLCAVLSRRGGVYLGDKDVFINVSGGVNVNSPSLDLAVSAAIKSSFQDKKISSGQIYAGEVSLTGGVKRFLGIDRVVSEASRLGYEGFVGPVRKSKGKLGIKTVQKVTDI